MAQASGGLAEVVAGSTAISEVTQTGLRYRGYEIADLAEHCSCEEVAYLLLYGELPTRAEMESFRARVTQAMHLQPEVVHTIEQIPVGAPLMDVMRTAVSVLAHYDPDVSDSSPAANLRKSERLLGQIPAVLGRHLARRATRGMAPPRPEAGHAHNVLLLLTGREPPAEDVKVMDLSLVLYAEHEFNASTFTARVIVSTLSDMHSGIAGAIGALKGPLHGGANEAAMEMLLEIDSPDRAEPFMREGFAIKRKIMGFGHRVYKHGDHRAKILETAARQLADRKGLGHFNAIADIVAGVMQAEKHIHPNLDWPAARAYFAMGLPIDSFTPIFVASRVAGWCAHIMEQLADNRLIRPSSQYIGLPPRAVAPIDQR
jgi:2-methylcitrate synthase/citrate synthase II